MKHFLLAAALIIATLTAAAAQTKDFGSAVRMAKVPGIELSRIQCESF
ncbi:hypothetical protein [Sulfitobacter sp.]